VTYRIEFDRAAAKELLALPNTMRDRIGAALEKLALNPAAAANVKALKGGGYRLRVGDYRVLYKLKNEILVVLVIKIAHRRDAYRQ
jgi:mRNA interferase RelE/StbE